MKSEYGFGTTRLVVIFHTCLVFDNEKRVLSFQNDLIQVDFETNDDITCQNANLSHHTEILLETRNSDLTWPEELYTLATRSKAPLPPPPTANTNNQSPGNVEPENRGLIGLSNLGNTCFLNASVQCLSHSYPLTLYFLHKLHLYEINR